MTPHPHTAPGGSSQDPANSSTGAGQPPVEAFYSAQSGNPHRAAPGHLGKAHSFVSPLMAQTVCTPDTTPPALSPAQAMAGAFTVTLPWPSPILSPNWRGAKQVKWKATREYRKACADAAWQQGASPLEAVFPTAVEFCPPDARSYDDDNLTARFKAGRDGLADALGMDDKKFRLPATIGQPVKGGAVRVTLTPIPA